MISEKTINIKKEVDIIHARQEGREMARDIGFGTVEQCRIATAISELTRNIIRYAGYGKVIIKVINRRRKGIEITCSDEGPGIPDIEIAMQDGFSTNRGLGSGLPGTKRLMDEFEIKSEVDNGTTVVIRKWLR
jgi:serine/threonine-protein kinase RsbT